ncbi:MAG: HlyD family efflux transporter periplasmic adaptor subunit [Psychrobium sp.]|nr:HlyD family efflux transporter periplasmic adaptor subunit [Psychrobium sp.]
MQIPRDKQSSPTKLLLGFVAGILLLLAFYVFSQSKQVKTTFPSSVPTMGLIVTSISAYGSLQPKSRYSILGLGCGNIDKISLRPGDKVVASDPIITLVNPKLLREAEQVQLSLLGERAVFEKLLATQKMELSRQKAQLQLTQYDLTIALSRLSAKKKLAKQKIISDIDLQEVELQYQKANLMVRLEKEAINTLGATQAAEIKAQQFYLQRANKHVELMQRDIDNLVIRAGISGVIVKLDSELEQGLRIAEGKVLGQIADPKSLYALLRVQASQASLLALHQGVDISIKGRNIHGEIERISPNVENATVEIEVKLIGVLPENTMSNTAVTASIHIESLQQTMLLAKPPHVNYPGRISVVVKNINQYEIRKITIGWVGEEQVQILNGLSLNDQVLMLSPKKWKESVRE